MKKSILPDAVYDILKWVAIIALPAFGVFYERIGMIWGFPYTEQICGTIDALSVLLGALLCVSAIQYAAGKAAEGQKSAHSEESAAEVVLFADKDYKDESEDE